MGCKPTKSTSTVHPTIITSSARIVHVQGKSASMNCLACLPLPSSSTANPWNLSVRNPLLCTTFYWAAAGTDIKGLAGGYTLVYDSMWICDPAIKPASTSCLKFLSESPDGPSSTPEPDDQTPSSFPLHAPPLHSTPPPSSLATELHMKLQDHAKSRQRSKPTLFRQNSLDATTTESTNDKPQDPSIGIEPEEVKGTRGYSLLYRIKWRRLSLLFVTVE